MTIRLTGAGEDGEHTVAQELAFDVSAAVFADDRAKGRVEVAPWRGRGRR